MCWVAPPHLQHAHIHTNNTSSNNPLDRLRGLFACAPPAPYTLAHPLSNSESKLTLSHVFARPLFHVFPHSLCHCTRLPVFLLFSVSASQPFAIPQYHCPILSTRRHFIISSTQGFYNFPSRTLPCALQATLLSPNDRLPVPHISPSQPFTLITPRTPHSPTVALSHRCSRTLLLFAPPTVA